MYTIYFAGAYSNKGSVGPIGVGVIFTKEGIANPVFQISEECGTDSRNSAYYRSLIRAMKEMLNRGFANHPRISFICENELVINQIKGRSSCDSPSLRDLLEEVRSLRKLFSGQVTISCQRTDETEKALQLGKQAIAKYVPKAVISSKI